MYTRFALCIVLFLSLGGCFHPSKSGSGSGGGSNSGGDGGNTGGNNGGNTTITCPKDCPWENYPQIPHSSQLMTGWLYLYFIDNNGQMQMNEVGDDSDEWKNGHIVFSFPEGTFLHIANPIMGTQNFAMVISPSNLSSAGVDANATTYLHTYFNGKFLETGTVKIWGDKSLPPAWENILPFFLIPDRELSPLAYKTLANMKEGDSFYFYFDMQKTDGSRTIYLTPDFTIKKAAAS